MTPLALMLAIVGEPSPVAIDQHVMMGAALIQSTGELPAFAGAERFERHSVWIHARGGVADSAPNTVLGTQFGSEFDIRLGITPDESKEIHDSFPIGFGLRAGLSMRAFTFNVPFQGMLVAHLSSELGAGGGHWWSDTARFSFLGGARFAAAGPGDANLEVDYTIVPFVITGSPGDLQIRHLEHRITLAAGAGSFGIGAWVTLSRQQWRTSRGDAYETTTGHAIGASLEWRPR